MAGFVVSRRDLQEDEMTFRAGAMAAALTHRGPDATGTWVDPSAGIALGHARLSIIDLSENGAQPMTTADGRYVISYNGEIYNYLRIRRCLEEDGRLGQWRGHSDTEVLLAAVSRWGVTEALKRVNGMFSIALWDRQNRELHLARDPVGEKPLYFGWHHGSLVFGSELKALHAYPDFHPEIDPASVRMFIARRYVPQPHSIFRGIQKVMPGEQLTFGMATLETGGDPHAVRFWSVDNALHRDEGRSAGGDEDQWIDGLEEKLRESVRCRMISDVSLGAFLSGGIDSSVIAALMQETSSIPVRTYSIGFENDTFDESPHARAVAAHLGTEHTEFRVTADDALEVIPHLATIYDEPFADASQIPTYLLARLARQRVAVCLSGDGGDEVFGGYARYGWARLGWRLIKRVPRTIRRRTGDSLWNRGTPIGAVTKMLGRIPGVGRRATASRIDRVADLLHSTDVQGFYSRLMATAPFKDLVALTGPLDATDCAPFKCDRELSLVERLMLVDFLDYLPNDILVKVDRAAMSVGLETRLPLLDPEVVSFAWQIPRDIKSPSDEPKRVLKRVLFRRVPERLFDRPKHGFGVPIGEWLRGPLREWGEELLDPKKIQEQSFFDPHVARRFWDEHVSGDRNREALLWSLLMFLAWAAEETNRGAS